MIRKLLKILGILLLLLVVGFGCLYFIYNEKLPEGQSGPEADALAQKMLTSLNNEKYQNTRFLEWSFRGGAYEYKWDRQRGMVEVKWDDYLVQLDLISPNSSIVFKNEQRLNGNESSGLIEDAMDNFNNDSFWLVAPYKIFDKGTKRSIVQLEDGLEGLLVTYNSGGTTPGDSYLWILQPSGFPKSYKMWVKIIPIGGIEATWDDWAVMESGAFLPKTHQLGPLEISMGAIRGYNR